MVEAASHERWTAVEELLATLIEHLDLTNRLLHAGFNMRGTPKPVEIRRPGAPKPEPTGLSALHQLMTGR